jgi:uncharacterized membrane protein
MGAAKFVFAVVSVFLLGTAAGAFAHLKDGSGYAVPTLLAICGIVAAVAAWKSDKLVRAFSKPSAGESVVGADSHEHKSDRHDDPGN